MTQEPEFQIKTQKELLDEQILHEDGRFKFGILDTNKVLGRSLARMRANGWILRGIETRGFFFHHSHYVFERSAND
jgi:hypothetical protein